MSIGYWERLCAAEHTKVKRLEAELEAAKEAIAGLADGGYGICDMCSLYGNNKDTTQCPYGCYHTSGIQRSIGTYPDDPCDKFVYASPCAENGGVE